MNTSEQPGESATPESAVAAAVHAVLHRKGDARAFAPESGLPGESAPAAEAILWRNRRALIEALIFASEEPLSIQRLCDVAGGTKDEIRCMVEELREAYERFHGLTIIEVAGGYRITCRPEFAEIIRKIYGRHKQMRLTAPALETLAIVAYKQPLTRAEVEQLRGVATDGVIHTLLERGLIKIVGRKEELGRPFLYGTTRAFLEYFGLQSLRDLPPVHELDKMIGTVTEKEKDRLIEGDPNAGRAALKLSDEELRGLWTAPESSPAGESGAALVTQVAGDAAFESALADLTWSGDQAELAAAAESAPPDAD